LKFPLIANNDNDIALDCGIDRNKTNAASAATIQRASDLNRLFDNTRFFVAFQAFIIFSATAQE